MYPFDRMKTLIILFKDYDKNIMSKDCQMHYVLYLFEKKGDLFIFFRQFVELPAKNQPLLDYF